MRVFFLLQENEVPFPCRVKILSRNYFNDSNKVMEGMVKSRWCAGNETGDVADDGISTTFSARL